MEDAIAQLKALGAEIVEVDLPHARAAMSAYYVLGPCEAFSNLARFDSVRYGYCDPEITPIWAASTRPAAPSVSGRRPSAASCWAATCSRRACTTSTIILPNRCARSSRKTIRRPTRRVDCILTPVSPRTAFKFGEIGDPTEMYLSDMFTISINIAGNGGMSFPVGLGRETGLPVGVQLISPAFKDANMLRVAAALETVYGKAPVAPAFAEEKGAE